MVDEWVWRFADVRYLPLWDMALARRGAVEPEMQALAETLIDPQAPAAEAAAPPPAAEPDEEETAAEQSPPPERRKKRKARPAPSTICEDELLEAFSK